MSGSAMIADAIFRAAVAAVRTELPAGVNHADLGSFLARHGGTLRAQLTEILADQPVMPVVAPGTVLWPVFHIQGVPKRGERGYRAELAAEDIAEELLDVALDYLSEPELFWAWTATCRAHGSASLGDWWVPDETQPDDDAPWSNPDELPELLEVPHWMTRERRRELALRVIQRAMEVEGRALSVDAQPDGRLPRWAAIGLIADELRRDAPMRLVNVSKATAAAFIEKHHSVLPCINLRGIMYAIGVRARGRLVAVATAGSPTGRWKRVDPRNVLELTRLASDGSTKNAASMLVARLLDLRERSRRGRPDEPALFVTYQLSEAEGAVYRAVQDKGLRAVARVPGRKPSGARSGGRRTPCQRRTGALSSLARYGGKPAHEGHLKSGLELPSQMNVCSAQTSWIPMPRSSKLTPFSDLVSTVPDREIAVMAGCSIATVCHYRQRHHIPSYRSRLSPEALEAVRVPDAPAPSVLRASSEEDNLQGYAATMRTDQGNQEVYLIARDIVAAAERAVEFGSVLGIAHIGPALVAP